jgi:hypothetical protein
MTTGDRSYWRGDRGEMLYRHRMARLLVEMNTDLKESKEEMRTTLAKADGNLKEIKHEIRDSQDIFEVQRTSCQDILKEEMLSKLDAHHERMMGRMDSQLEKMETRVEKGGGHYIWRKIQKT